MSGCRDVPAVPAVLVRLAGSQSLMAFQLLFAVELF